LADLMWRSLRCLSAALLYVCLARDTCEDGSCQGQEPTAMLQARSKIKANCTGNRCGRKRPSSVLQRNNRTSESIPEFQIQEDGSWNTYFLPGATVHDKRAVTYGINDKYYLKKLRTADNSEAQNFKMLELPGKTLIVEVDLNGAGCGCNVNFFLVSMPAAQPGEYGDYYCDGNGVGGNFCPEFDTNEMNQHALQITNHNCWDPWSRQSCDGDGDPEMKFYPGEFGPGDWNKIDTNQKFFFSVQMKEVIYGDSDPANHLIVETRAWQGPNRVIKKQMGGANSPMNGMWGNLAKGMVLVIDYWESQDLTWLDGAACHAPSYCSGNKATISNMQLIKNDNPSLSARCPAKEGYSCDWADQEGACDNDDATEGWCRCCCTKCSSVPRCLWSGYSSFS